MCWDILSNKIKYISFALSKVPNVTLDHKTSHKGSLFEIEIYT